MEKIPLTMFDGVINIKTQFLEVGDDDQPSIRMLALIIESLCFNLRKVCGLMVFQFYYTNDFAILKNSTVSFLGVGLVLLFGNEVVFS